MSEKGKKNNPENLKTQKATEKTQKKTLHSRKQY